MRKQRHLRDVLLGLVEALLQVPGRSLAGDLHHGQLLVVPGQVTGGSTDAVGVLLLGEGR